MTEPSDPPRYVDDGSAPSGLARLLADAKSDLPTDAQLSELRTRLGPLLAAPAPLPRGPMSRAALPKLVAVTAAAGVVVAASWWLRAREARPLPAKPLATQSAPTAATAALPADAPGIASVGSPVPPPSASPSLAASPSASLSSPPAAGVPSGKSSSLNAAASALTEAALLERARSELSAQPAAALADAQLHAARFPHGLLAQEREVIAIAALRRLGRSAEANARAARFDARYPNSAHQHTVDDVPAR